MNMKDQQIQDLGNHYFSLLRERKEVQKDEKLPKKEVKLISSKRLNKNWDEEEDQIFLTEQENSSSKIRYSITPVANKKLMRSYITIKDLSESLENTSLDMSKKEFDKIVVKPVEALINSKVHSKQSNSFAKKRTVTSSFVKIYKKLQKEGVNMSSVDFDEENEVSSLSSASKMMRLYISHFDLKGGKKTSKFPLDPFLSRQFSNEALGTLYRKNQGDIITQGQIQTLASLLVGPVV